MAHDGPSAVDKASGPDVVLCDIGLPGMSAYDVARALRADEALAGARLVAVSGYAQPEDLKEATAAGFDRHVAKPPDPAEIERLLGVKTRGRWLGIDPDGGASLVPFTQIVRRGVVTHCADSPPCPSVRARLIGACMRHGIDDVAAMYGELSRRDLVSIVEMGHGCVEARTCSDVAEVIDRLGTMLSFSKAAACSVLANGEHAGMQHFINHSYGSAWADLYTERNYVAVDPVIQHALRVDGAFEWREAFGSGVAESASEFLDAARDFGLGQGVSYSCRTRRMQAPRTVLSLSLDDPGECERAKLLLTGVGPHVHEAYVRVRAQRADDDCRAVLTDREKEVLDWAKQGKTYWEIGRILGISQRTVKFHFANIKARLDVVSECHAVAKAMSMGLIA